MVKGKKIESSMLSKRSVPRQPRSRERLSGAIKLLLPRRREDFPAYFNGVYLSISKLACQECVSKSGVLECFAPFHKVSSPNSLKIPG